MGKLIDWWRGADSKATKGTNLVEVGTVAHASGLFGSDGIVGQFAVPGTNYHYIPENTISLEDFSFNFHFKRSATQDFYMLISGSRTTAIDALQFIWDRRTTIGARSFSFRIFMRTPGGATVEIDHSFIDQPDMDAFLPLDTWLNVHIAKRNVDGLVKLWLDGVDKSLVFFTGSAATITGLSGTFNLRPHIATGRALSGTYQAEQGCDGLLQNVFHWNTYEIFRKRYLNGQRGALDDLPRGVL